MPRLSPPAIALALTLAAAPLHARPLLPPPPSPPPPPAAPTATTTPAATPTATPIVAPTADDYWALAPATATMGVVIDGPSVEAGLVTATALRSALVHSPHPDLGAALTRATTIAGVDVLSAEGLRTSGFDPHHGIAYFYQDEDVIAIVRPDGQMPVGLSLSTCDRRGAFRVCAPSADVLKSIGKNAPLAVHARTRSPRLRGGLEATLTQDGQLVDIAASMTRGRVELRVGMQVAGVPVFTRSGPSPLLSFLDTAPATGVLAIDVRDFHQMLPMITSGSELAPLVDALRGDVVAASLRGTPIRGWVRLGLRDVAAARDLLARCDTLPLPAPLRATVRKGVCELTGLEPAGVKLRLRFRIDGDVLVGETHPGAAAERGSPDPRLLAVAAEPAVLLLWGRGLGSTPALPEEMPPWVTMALPWWLAHVDEIGVALDLRDGVGELRAQLGTSWQNPDAVLAPLEALIAKFAAGQDTHRRVVALAKKYPGTPLAADVAAGPSGLVLPLGVVALGVSIATPFGIQPDVGD